MKDNVLIKIKTYQDIEGDGDEPIELETTGRFGVIGDKYYIMYDESEMTGFANTSTTIKIWGKNVIVTRRGRFNMKICYVEGEQNLCLYPTPYGEIGASVKTFDVKYKLNKDKGCGKVKVDYSIDADNEHFCKNSLNISIEPLNAAGLESKRPRTKLRYVN